MRLCERLRKRESKFVINIYLLYFELLQEKYGNIHYIIRKVVAEIIFKT